MEVSVFGIGYVGCVTIGCLSESGHTVIGVDKDSKKVILTNEGKPTIIEKDISNLLSTNHSQGKISATQDSKEAVLNSVISIISVGTPSTSEGSLNLEYVFNVAEEIGTSLKLKKEFHTILIRSTVLPGTNKKVGKIIEKSSGKKVNEDFAVVSNPEFLREGTAVYDYYNPPIILLGSESSIGIKICEDLYSDIESKIIKTDVKIAELIKYVNNTFHALKVSFANEIGNICKSLNIDSHDLMDIFVADRKLNLSPYYLKPGFAYGGSCLPKDLKALEHLSNESGLHSPIIEAIEESNSNQKQVALSLIKKLGKEKICFLGVSFKDGTDDLRNSPVIELIDNLIKEEYLVSAYDYDVSTSLKFGSNKSLINSLSFNLEQILSSNLEKVIADSEVLVICKKDKRFSLIRDHLNSKKVVDLVRFFDDQSHDNYIGLCW